MITVIIIKEVTFLLFCCVFELMIAGVLLNIHCQFILHFILEGELNDVIAMGGRARRGLRGSCDE